MRRLASLALSLVLAVGISACGGDDESVSDIVPRSVPELRAPESTSLPAAPASTDTTSTTDTTTTTTTTPATAAPAPATTTPQQTGGAAPQQQQGTTTGNSGGFSDFCAQNPGACPGN